MAAPSAESPPPERGSAEASVGSSVTNVMRLKARCPSQNSLSSTTMNGVLAVGSSIVDITPHLAGAIDIIVVRQPDGSLKSTPSYVRFGKFVERWSTDKTVTISVNGDEMPFTMRLGRTGEAYFLREEGNDSASHDSGSSAAEQGDAGPGAAIEHIVAARETAQALESLDSAQVEPDEAAAAASQLMAHAASEVLRLRAQPPSPTATTNAAAVEQHIQPDSAAGSPEHGRIPQRDRQASTPADAVAPFGQLPAPRAAINSNRDGERRCLPPLRTTLAVTDNHSTSSSSAGTGPSTPDVETAAVPTAMSAPHQLRRAISGDSASSDEESAVGSDAGTCSASPEAAETPLPPASAALAGLADAELSLCATAIYYADSPEEVWAEFESARVPWEDYAERPEEFIADPELTIRIGEDIMPWREAQAHVVGLLFYGANASAALKPIARITVAKPQGASVAAHEPGEDAGAGPAQAPAAVDSNEDANNSAGHQEDASDSDYEDAADTLGLQDTEDADIIAAAPSGDVASHHQQNSNPLAALAPAPANMANACAEAGEEMTSSDRQEDAARAGQPAVLPALSPAVPGTWATRAQSSHGSLPAAEGSKDKSGGLIEGAEAALLAEANLSLSGDRLLDDASPEEVRDVFDAGLVSEEQFCDDGAAIMRDANLLCRIGGSVYRWRHALPALAGRLAYPMLPWRRLLRRGMPSAGPADGSNSPSASPQEGIGERGWGSWLPKWRSPPPQQTASAHALLQSGAGAAVASSPAAQRQTCQQRSFVPTSDELAAMPVRDGRNDITFRAGQYTERAFVHVIPWTARIVISDVDGTITKSDVLGHVLPLVSGHHWSQFGITRLYHGIQNNGYFFIYLSSRSIGQAALTRDYLQRLHVDGHKLPLGPVIISPDGLVPSLYREMVVKRPYEFKIRCLENIRQLFPPARNPFHAGFGNRHTDERSYRAVGIPDARIFTINKHGELRRSSEAAAPMPLASITALTPHVFPPYVPSRGPIDVGYNDAFSDPTFWRLPPRLVDV